MPSKKSGGLNQAQAHRLQVQEALREIEPLVRRIGTSPIYGALREMAMRAKKKEKLEALKKQVAELEEEVTNAK